MDLDVLLRQANLNGNQVAELLRALSVRTYVDVVAVVPAGASTVTVLHGLGRAMNGALVGGLSNPAVAASVSLPGTAAGTSVTVNLSSAPVTATTVLLRVY